MKIMKIRLCVLLAIFSFIPGPLPVHAGILWEYWANIPGSSVENLTGDSNYPDYPAGIDFLDIFEAPSNWNNNYGTRMRGYIVAPATGDYVFWISSDDNSELWLSVNDDPDYASMIANVTGWTSLRQWNKFSTQKSKPIHLEEGNHYYVEVLHKEGSGEDNLSVGWSKPGQSTSSPSEVMPGDVLLPWTGYDTNYNFKPSINVTGELSFDSAPETLQLVALVKDDGKPLPAHTANPDENDNNKLRWSWSVVSVPSESNGVTWLDGPNYGEAFTYEGSNNKPGTVFICDPCATFDVPGSYVLEFSASDGNKETVEQISVLIGSSDLYRELGYLYLSPVPSAEYIPTGTEYILVRFSEIIPQEVSNLSSFITVWGEKSGNHPGQTHIASDGRTIIFDMDNGFVTNERVSVSLNPVLGPSSANIVEPYFYQFMVSTNFPDADTVTSRGDIPPEGAKENAFDGNANTKWMDYLVPDGINHNSWIQLNFPGIEGTRTIDKYTLTSANDAPENDPMDWFFYGIDESDQLVLLDVQTNRVFSARGQKKTYTINNVTAYRGYRLEITKVNDPENAFGVQLAEIEFHERSALLREYWLDIGGNSISNLINHPDYPDNPSGSDYLSKFMTPTDWADSYGTRVSGYLTAPITGNYVFWISSDDNGQLWLSKDDNPANSNLIASVPGWTSPQEWNKYSSQKSNSIFLIGGESYYIEALQKEGGGGDNLAVGWAKPGQNNSTPSEVIPGEVLSASAITGSVSVQSIMDAASNSVSEQETISDIQFQLFQANPSGPRISSNGVSIPSDFPEILITVNRNPSDGYIFIPYPHNASSRQRYVMMLDNNGDPVWYKRGNSDAWNEFKVQDNGTITMEIFNGYDNNMNWLKRYQARNGYVINHHDLEVLEDGGYLMIADNTPTVDVSRLVQGGNPSARVTQTIIQEYTAQDELIFQYRAWDNYDVTDMQIDNNRGGSFRFPHINAIDVDDDGHLVISCRHLSEITKINRDTGEKIWRLGGAHSDFTFVNDTLNGFRNQHDVTALGNNHYLLFDNGNGHNPPVSRAVEYELDLENMTATLVWQYRETPDFYTYYMGNAQRLPNGNTLINFVLANYPKIIEVNPEGIKLFEMYLLPGSDLYRAFRFPWDGAVEVPYLIVESHDDEATLIFNKFGDKNVDHYNIYGDTTPEPTKFIVSSTDTLEQLANLDNGIRYYFRVTAVDANGLESDYSNEESIRIAITQTDVNIVRNGDFSGGIDGWIWQTPVQPASAD